MNKRIILGIAGGGLLLCISAVGSCMSWHDNAVKLESSTKAQWSENQNTYDAFWKTIKESAQIPEKYKEDFKEVLVAETQAKFGEGGSSAMFQFFQDRDINFDASIYKKLQTQIEAGRQDFRNSQKTLLDKQMRYENHLHTWSGRMWGGFYDFPNEVGGDLAPPRDKDGDGKLTVMDYPIVTSKKTKQTFATGEDEALEVF